VRRHQPAGGLSATKQSEKRRQHQRPRADNRGCGRPAEGGVRFEQQACRLEEIFQRDRGDDQGENTPKAAAKPSRAPTRGIAV
jgi:hypothetical protein